MAIMVAMNTQATSKTKPMDGRSKSLRTISLENSTASLQMAPINLSREVAKSREADTAATFPTDPASISLRNMVSDLETWGGWSLKIKRDSQITTGILLPPPCSFGRCQILNPAGHISKRTTPLSGISQVLIMHTRSACSSLIR